MSEDRLVEIKHQLHQHGRVSCAAAVWLISEVERLQSQLDEYNTACRKVIDERLCVVMDAQR